MAQRPCCLLSNHTDACAHAGMHTRAYTSTHTHTCMHTRMHTRTCTQTHTHAHTRMHTHMHANTHTRMHACMHARMHTRTHTRMHAHARTHAHTHTRTHPHTSVSSVSFHRSRLCKSFLLQLNCKKSTLLFILAFKHCKCMMSLHHWCIFWKKERMLHQNCIVSISIICTKKPCQGGGSPVMTSRRFTLSCHIQFGWKRIHERCFSIETPLV